MATATARGAAPKPWDRPFPALSYSESQERRRRQCARAHYYHVFAAHRGWEAPPLSVSWAAYRLKRAVPLFAAVGTVVHDAANACAQAVVARRRLPTFDALYGAAADALNRRWSASRRERQRFLARPSEVPMYLEALYRDGPTGAQLWRARRTLEITLAALLDQHELWSWVARAGPGDVVVVDPFTSIVLADDVVPEGIVCYGAADLLVRPSPDAPWHLVDFKTGAADGVVDQLFTCALVARGAFGIDVSGARGAEAALMAPPTQQLVTFGVSADDLRDGEARVRGCVAAARTLVRDPMANAPREIEAFPQTSDACACRSCAYRGLCFPELNPFRS